MLWWFNSFVQLVVFLVNLIFCISFILLSDDKILDSSTLEACIYDKLSIAQVGFMSPIGQTTVGKEENADYQHLLLFPPCFKSTHPLSHYY